MTTTYSYNGSYITEEQADEVIAKLPRGYKWNLKGTGKGWKHYCLQKKITRGIDKGRFKTVMCKQIFID